MRLLQKVPEAQQASAGAHPAVRRYFGETGVYACGMCDLCLSPPEATDVTEAAQKALSAVHRLGGRFGRGRIVDHLLGNTKKALASETQLSTYGIGRELSAGVGVISSISFCSKEGRDHGRYRNNKRTAATR
jgi:superfamily II DNA helicase RecQ